MLYEDRDLADEMGRNGRKYVEARYTWPVVMKGVEESLAIAREKFAGRTVKLSGRD